jgi:2-oxo-4-hydroxy-4-carboxy-5-ureidoimidazoline decarboxylase
MQAAPRSGLELVNTADRDEFVALLARVFENSAWIADEVFAHRPFQSIEELHQAMMRCVLDAPPSRQLALIRAHPELAGREAVEGTMTAASSGEQDRLGLTRLAPAELAWISELNRRYREKFGFPCIVALRLHETRESVMAEMARRIENDATTEVATALRQIGQITRGRLMKVLSADG